MNFLLNLSKKTKIILIVLCCLFLLLTALLFFLLPGDKKEVASNQNSTDSSSNLPTAGELPPLSALISSPPLSSVSDVSSNEETPIQQEKLKGVWVSYLELGPMLQGKTKDEFSASFDSAMSFVNDMGFDTVFVQVRPFGDALYPSKHYPWSHLVTGTRGTEPDFDPLELMLEITGRYGLSFHAWLNPYRITANIDSFSISASDPIAARSDVLSCDNGLYLNPASESAQSLIVAGAKELLESYPEIDGIHLDDYFYPTTDAAFDQDSYASYLSSGGTLSLSKWRTNQVTSLIKQLYRCTKQAGPQKLFGISPAGNMQTVISNHYVDLERLVADDAALDYICPQIYFGFQNQTMPFESVYDDWKALCLDKPCSLFVGLPFYKSGKEDAWAGSGKDEFLTPGVLSRMTALLLSEKDCAGLVFYSLDSLMQTNEISAIDLANCKGRLLANQ